MKYFFQVISCAACLGVSAISARGGDDPPIYRLDLSEFNRVDMNDPVAVRRAWDTIQVAATIQGNVNRKEARVFLRCMPQTDDFWWDYLRSDGQWLAGRKVIEVQSVGELLDIFGHELAGAVLYRESEPFASNLASTIAGAETRFVLRHDETPGSLYHEFIGRPSFPKNVVSVPLGSKGEFLDKFGNITGTREKSTGSIKNDAYRWASANYLEKGRCGTTDLAYFLDAWWLREPNAPIWNATLANHDFYLAQKSFFFDLNPLPGEVPVDDPGQRPGLDRETLTRILREMHDRVGGKIYAIGGFLPWAWKYVGPDGEGFPGSGGNRHPVQGEWEYAKLVSAFNAYKDADALGYSGMANASFYRHFPLKSRYPQPAPDLTDKTLQAEGYLDKKGQVVPRQYFTWYCGDYDSSAWLNRFVPLFWADPARGSLPLNWAFNPTLARRAPHAMDYARAHATPADYFMAGDSGAGYLNPGMLAKPRLDPLVPDGWNAWIAHNKDWFSKFDLSITGFIIDGLAPSINEYGYSGYARFSGRGLGSSTAHKPWGVSPEGVPYAWVRDVGHENYTSIEAGASNVLANVESGLQFRILRTILNSPTWHFQVADKVTSSPGGENACFVSAPIFFELLRRSAVPDSKPRRK